MTACCRCPTTAYDQDTAKAVLAAAVHATQITAAQLWLAYVSVGGDLSRGELPAALFGSAPLTQCQYGLVAIAFSELIWRE